MSGSLEVICGSMFSGKSEELIRRLNRSKIAGKDVAAFKPVIDNRYKTEWLTTHNGVEFPCFHVDSFVVNTIHDVIGIDEVQFFGDQIIKEIQATVHSGKQVIVAGLDMTYRQEPFGIMPHLMAIADQVTKLSAVCHQCGNDAIFTQRLIDGQPASFKGATVQVGGLDSYEARCRSCFQTG